MGRKDQGRPFQHISAAGEILYTEGMEVTAVPSDPPGRPKTALLLIAHGSREEEANADLVYVAEQLQPPT